jgi:hypothetical protein
MLLHMRRKAQWPQQVATTTRSHNASGRFTRCGSIFGKSEREQVARRFALYVVAARRDPRLARAFASGLDEQHGARKIGCRRVQMTINR